MIGLIWDNDDIKHKIVDSLVPRGRITDYWCAPNPTEEEVTQAADPEVVSRTLKNSPEELAEYLDRVKTQMSYPLYWQSLRVRMPVQEIFNAKVGSIGDNAKDRVDYQVLNTLLSLYGKIPGFPIKKLFSKIKQISEVSTPFEPYMTKAWGAEMEKMLLKLDKDALLRTLKMRLREETSNYKAEITSQWEADEDSEAFLDKLPKTLVVLIPDVQTEQEASFIAELTGGILVHVNEGNSPPKFKKSVRKKTAYLDGDQEPVQLRNAIHDIAIEMRN